ncbi:hypothetical protein I79_007092 [Cricetulus griseus]|uniref:Uncharacterized protein n=1 Tax=Cricetulus griseus TaxID=10029 RepID=G3H9L6_CRIGR|nr:hypothetical protein I79_007092 [Cricetulus griseus]
MLMGQALYQLNHFARPSFKDPPQHRKVLENDLMLLNSVHPPCASRIVYTLSTMIGKYENSSSLNASRGLRYFSKQIFSAKPKMYSSFNIFNYITTQYLSKM